MSKFRGADPITELAVIAVDWSQPCGCFERHLQRRWMNPLFPVERRRISFAELRESKARDQGDLLELEANFRGTATRIFELADATPRLGLLFEEVNQQLDVLQGLLLRAAEIGDLANRLREAVRKPYDHLMQSVRGVRESLDLDSKLEIDAFIVARRRIMDIYSNQFISQMKRADTPILSQEVLHSVLTEPLTTVRLFASLIPHAVRGELRIHALAVALVQGVEKEGYAVQGSQEKLSALSETPYEAIPTTKVF
jgi:hypothetical protein